MSLKGRDIVSIRDLSREEIDEILAAARRMIPYAEGTRSSGSLSGRIVVLAFFEPSTRTRLSFDAAVQRLGGRSLTIADASESSLRKGESLNDTIRMLAHYGDAIVLRHPNEGAARLAAMVSDRPVLNAGDGAGQHPTQTLVDLATIRESFGTLAGLRIVLLGDLRHGRTVHSLARALAIYGSAIRTVSPPGLSLPPEVAEQVVELGGEIQEEASLAKAVRDADVLYVTRLQKERFLDPTEYAQVAGSYRVDAAALQGARDRLVVMHPLPRTGEIAPELDATPRAAYFRQAFLAVPVRMALLGLVLNGKVP